MAFSALKYNLRTIRQKNVQNESSAESKSTFYACRTNVDIMYQFENLKILCYILYFFTCCYFATILFSGFVFEFLLDSKILFIYDPG